MKESFIRIIPKGQVTMSSKKGEPIRFKGGKYSPETGWINTAKGHQGYTAQKVYVIIGTGTYAGMETIVEQTSITKRHEKPTNFAQEMYQEYHWMEKTMNKLAAKIAALDIDRAELLEISNIFMVKLLEADDALKKKGKDGMYYKVDKAKDKYKRA